MWILYVKSLYISIGLQRVSDRLSENCLLYFYMHTGSANVPSPN